MNKSFYIISTIIVLTVFVFLSVFLTGIANTDYTQSANLILSNPKIADANYLSILSIQLLTGAFSNMIFMRMFVMICILLSAYLIFNVIKRATTTQHALVLSYLYLSLTSIGGYKFGSGALVCLLSAFLVYIYYLKYDGLIKWYIMLITLSILAIHNSVFVFAIFLFPFFCFSRIKRQKTSWTAFVNMIILFALAFFIKYQFIGGFPVNIMTVKGEWVKMFFTDFGTENIIITILFLFGATSFLFCPKFIKGYMKFSVISMMFYILSYKTTHTGATYLMFLPPIYTSFAVSVSHLKAFRKNKKTFIITLTLISLIIFSSVLIFN